jgi:hypothetical protein
MDEEVKSVIGVGFRSEDKNNNFMIVIKHCQRTQSGQGVKNHADSKN